METKASQINFHLKVGKFLLLAVKGYSAYSYNPTFTLYSRRMTDKSAGKYNLSLQPPTSNESNHQVEAVELSSKKKRKRKNKDQTNAPFPSTSNESNHQVETENPSSKKKKRKHNRSSKLSIEKKRLREADKLRIKIENGTK